MTTVAKQEQKKTSLRFQYVFASAVVITLFFIAAFLASVYFTAATEENTNTIRLYETLNIKVDRLRNAVWAADKSLYTLLSQSSKLDEQEIRQRFSQVGKVLQDIAATPGFEKTQLQDEIQRLAAAHKKLEAELIRLLELRQDINWLYPMLPFITTTLLEANNNFETALSQAIQETSSSTNRQYFEQVYPLLDDLRNIWRLQILDFRGSLIRFIGLNTPNIEQEKNIESYHLLLNEKLQQLEQYGREKGLEFETELAVEEMQKNAAQWYQNYQQLLKIRRTNTWRSDIKFIQDTIQPLQKIFFNELNQLEQQLQSQSLKNTQLIDDIAEKIYWELGLLTILAILFVVFIYFRFNKSLLVPVEKITEIISTNVGETEKLDIVEHGSKEIDVLIHAFNNMRKQVHHREMVLEFQAMHDSLTGLPNRALLQDRLEQGIHYAERNNSKMSLLLLDLDRFKDINDTLGHPVGDVVLRKVSRRLEECLRATDTVARLGGDEFAIITNDSEHGNVVSFIERITKNVERVITVENQNLYVGLSVGVATYPDDGKDADTLIQHADVAMYSAKRENRNYAFYKPEADYYSIDNLNLLAELKAELKKPDGRLKLYFQPQTNLLSGEVSSVEALIRWEHPEQGLLSAEQIVSMSEQTGLISELTWWVFHEAIKYYLSWGDNDFTLSINLSVWNLQDAELIPIVSRTLNEYRMPAEKLCFEITESAVMSDPVRSREVLKILHEMGIRIAIDDYGTGFSSLAYLKLLPVDYLKIDKSFVFDMLEDENDAIIVHSTIELAHNLGLTVVAEGVEKEQTMLKLRELGCNYVQGYYITRPVDASDMHDWLAAYQQRIHTH